MSTGGILSLDLAGTTGWAWRAPGMLRARHGIVSVGGGSHPAGWAALGDWLADFITTNAPDLIVFEAPLPPPKQTHAATMRFLVGLCAVTELIAWRRDTMCMEAARPTVTKTVLGNGRATKDEVVTWARAAGYDPATHDAADALCLLSYAERLRPHLMRTRPNVSAA
jgi:Holliday junction resolvasome RuvABC endonuclease subunit